MKTVALWVGHWAVVNAAILLAGLAVLGVLWHIDQIQRRRLAKRTARQVLRQPRVLKIMREAVTLRIDAQSDTEAADKLTNCQG